MAQSSGRIQVFESLEPRQQRSMLVGVLVLVAVVMGVVNTIASGDTDWRGLTDSFSTELLGAALTFFIFDLLQERRNYDELRLRLGRELVSRESDTAVRAINVLRETGFLFDGSLAGINLFRANLEDTYLEKANLPHIRMQRGKLKGAVLVNANFQGADLSYSDLEDTWLWQANLQDTWMFEVNLKDANLERANLQEADLHEANLQGANLADADLRGANLSAVNLQGANLERAKFNTETKLPDYYDNSLERSFWTPDTDMARFTDPDHPDFWRPSVPDVEGKYPRWYER